MIVQSGFSLSSLSRLAAPSSSTRQFPPAAAAIVANAPAASTLADSVRISPEARAALASSSSVTRSNEMSVDAQSVESRLAAISAQGKTPEQLTADELDYLQKATGLVNTFANLSAAERALYDKAVASGNTEAAAGISQIALIRMGGHTAGGANGTTYDPLSMEITGANIATYFSASIIDPTGQAASKFQALIQFLDRRS